MPELDPILAVYYRALALACQPPGASCELPNPLIVVNIARQRMALLAQGQLLREYTVSTAAKGIGSEEGSYQTPRGWHRIHACTGGAAPRGMIFRSRIATGELWQGEWRDEDLILSRILTLEGLEEGLNRGPGQDSLQRYIYIHGTNQEAQLGQPCSHGCIRMGNDDVMELFEQVTAGCAVLIAAGTELQDPLGLGRLHFAGVGGSGMSALAQFIAMRGGQASGSDRSFDRGQFAKSRAQLEALGVRIFPQDGSGLAGDCSALVYSTAVEETVPDFAQAKRLGVPLLHRSELLAHLVAQYRSLAISGTSGKSTTTAMAFEILRGAGWDPSVITGGDLRLLQTDGLWGNAWAGASKLLVIEADESDGSLVRYHPAVGVVLNLQKDHQEESVVADMFRCFRQQTREAFVVGEAPNLAEFRPAATVFGLGPEANLRAEAIAYDAEGSFFQVQDLSFRLPIPGKHNIENALAAMAACHSLGLPLQAMVEPLAHFQGVARRFQVLGEAQGVQVIDDFGHNPAKVAASIRTAHLRSGRVLAIFQPHGYGPMRFLRSDFVETFVVELAPEDRLWMLEIFYAGGTALRDFSSADIVQEIAQRGVHAEFAPSRKALIEALCTTARPGDCILLMGARDPSLSELAHNILKALQHRSMETPGP